MAVYLTGDTHGNIDIHKLATRKWKEGAKLSKNDLLVILGDFGLVWDGGAQDSWWLDWLGRKPWTTLFVDGNHENHRMLAEGFEEVELFGGHAHRIRDGIYHLMRGYVFDLPCREGTRSFAVMGGARSSDRAWRVEGRSWWPEEIPSDEERDRLEASLDERGWQVDHMLTHDAPALLVPRLAMTIGINPTARADEFQRWLGGIEYRLDYGHWWFGHWHMDIDLSPTQTALYREIRGVDE